MTSSTYKKRKMKRRVSFNDSKILLFKKVSIAVVILVILMNLWLNYLFIYPIEEMLLFFGFDIITALGIIILLIIFRYRAFPLVIFLTTVVISNTFFQISYAYFLENFVGNYFLKTYIFGLVKFRVKPGSIGLYNFRNVWLFNPNIFISLIYFSLALTSCIRFREQIKLKYYLKKLKIINKIE